MFKRHATTKYKEMRARVLDMLHDHGHRPLGHILWIYQYDGFLCDMWPHLINISFVSAHVHWLLVHIFENCVVLSDSWMWAVAEAVARCSSACNICAPHWTLPEVQIWTYTAHVASPGWRRGRISPLVSAGSIPSAAQIPLASFAAQPWCWFLSILASTLIPSSFSAKLLSAPACAELIPPLGQEFALSFITLIEFQAIHPGPCFHPASPAEGWPELPAHPGLSQWWITGEADGRALYPCSQVICKLMQQ